MQISNLRIWFHKHKIGKPIKMFSYNGKGHFHFVTPLFATAGDNVGIEIGLVNPFTRMWYKVSFRYDRFSRYQKAVQ